MDRRIRNDSWKEDAALITTLKQYVKNRWDLSTILSYMCRDFDEYAWSLRTLKRRLKHFSIRYIDDTVTDVQVAGAVVNELREVGKDLGFRAMTQKLRVKHNLRVAERKVLEVMHVVDPAGVQRRGNVGMKKGPTREKRFISPVSDTAVIPLQLYLCNHE